MEKEYYHTLEEYLQKGFFPFLEHAKNYLDGTRTKPISRTTSFKLTPIYLTFSNDLLGLFLRDQKMEKPYEMAIKYGYRGHSNGGINGIFNQRKEDKRLREKTEALLLKELGNKDEKLNERCSHRLKKVKIVWHQPNGQRIVGVYDYNDQIYFLGLGRY